MKHDDKSFESKRQFAHVSSTPIQKRWLAFFLAQLVVLAIGMETPASASELRYRLQCVDASDPSTCVQPLLRGEPAPFDGQLLPPRAALDLGLAAEALPQLLEIELERLTATASVTLTATRKLHEIELELQETEKDHWRERAAIAEDRLANPPLFERPLVVAGLSAAVTFALILVAIAALNAAGN